MSKTFTYINFKNLKDNELDMDFKKECIKNGSNDNSEINVIKVPSITGHDTYITEIEN